VQIPNANIVSSVMGAAEAKSREAASKLRKKRHEPRPEIDRPDGDEVVIKTESSESLRSMKGNEQEEAREDHEARAGYGPAVSPDDHDAPPPTIDLEG